MTGGPDGDRAVGLSGVGGGRPQGAGTATSSGAEAIALSGAEATGLSGAGAAHSATEVAELLGLGPHREGGFFRETYRSSFNVDTDRGARPLATSILYLLTAADPSRFHRLRSDEMWYFHSGCAAEMVMLPPSSREAPSREGAGRAETHLLADHRPQVLVPADTWLGVRVAPGGSCNWTLVGCAVIPGFEYADLDMADPEALLLDYPGDAEIIRALT